MDIREQKAKEYTGKTYPHTESMRFQCKTRYYNNIKRRGFLSAFFSADEPIHCLPVCFLVPAGRSWLYV